MMKGILHFIFSDLGPWKTWHFSDTKQFTYYTESIAYILKIKFPNQVLCIKDKLLNELQCIVMKRFILLYKFTLTKKVVSDKDNYVYKHLTNYIIFLVQSVIQGESYHSWILSNSEIVFRILWRKEIWFKIL